MHYWNNNYDGDGSYFVMMIIFMAVFGGLFAWVLITYLRRNSVGSTAVSAAGSPGVSAQALLNERLARGDISEEEFKSRSAALKSISEK